MRLLKNTGTDRVVDELRRCLTQGSTLDIATPALSLFAFGELSEHLSRLIRCRLVLPAAHVRALSLLGGESDRAYRNQLQSRWLARQCAAWLELKAEVRNASGTISQSTLSVADGASRPTRVVTGTCSFTTEGLGITPSTDLSLIQVAESAEECGLLGGWFTALWDSLPASAEPKRVLLERLRQLTAHREPALIYFLTLYHLFKEFGDLDEDRVVKAATGIRNTVVWKKLFKFQRDGVVGAIDKLERFGGCIIADSVGLGKTFEALAIIKYHELRNDRVLVLVPKRLSISSAGGRTLSRIAIGCRRFIPPHGRWMPHATPSSRRCARSSRPSAVTRSIPAIGRYLSSRPSLTQHATCTTNCLPGPRRTSASRARSSRGRAATRSRCRTSGRTWGRSSPRFRLGRRSDPRTWPERGSWTCSSRQTASPKARTFRIAIG